MRKPLKVLGLFLLAVLGGIFYRMGGAAGWNTKFRDVGVPLVMLCAMLLFNFTGLAHLWLWISLLVSFGLMWGALTTYWKKEGSDAKWWNWLLHGLGIALSAFPYCIYSGRWIGFSIRLVLLPLLVMSWALLMNRPVGPWKADVVNEWGRGFWSIVTLWLLAF